MGQVYRALDTRLNRAVAVKVIAPDISSSPEARQRFEREARTIAQLSHPNICAIYDVGHADVSRDGGAPGPVEYLVMELLEGDTLADRLAKGALPREETRRFCIQIAGALDSAHRAGIVHRDLKPANILLARGNGASAAPIVKLLDFGLAKAAAPRMPSVTDADTIAAEKPLTARGAVAGTVQYMAPELLDGRAADARSDIFAFGAVIYEMTTGRRAFGTPLQRLAPAPLDRLVRACLASNPDERYQSAHDVGLEIAALAPGDDADSAGAPASHRGIRAWMPWTIAAAIVLAVVAIATLRPARAFSTPAVARFLLPPPAGGAFLVSYETVGMAMAPDGSQVAFTATGQDGTLRLWVRPIADLEPRPLAGTEGAVAPFWSPDAHAIAFFTGGKLRRVDPNGGVPVTICDVREAIGFYGTWGSQGNILYSSIEGEAIYQVAASGGTPAILLKPEVSRSEARLNWPFFLPDGRRYLYLSRRRDGSGRLMAADPGKPSKELRPLQSLAQFVDPGFIVFASEGTLVGQRFDLSQLAVAGEPFSIADRVSYFLTTTVGRFSAARNGALVYQFRENQQRLVWFDRSGRELRALAEPAEFQRPRISPDGRRIAFDRLLNGAFDVWTMDLDRSTENRVTFGVSSEGTGPWTPDGRSLFFEADRGAPPEMFRKDLITGAEEQMAKGTGTFQEPEDLSPDGKTLLFLQRALDGSHIWMWPVDGSRPPTMIVSSPFEAIGSRFSPDGRWFSYSSNESGQPEVYLSPFPATGEKLRVSTSGVRTSARWNRHGGELFYVSAAGQLMAVPVQTSPSLRVGTPMPLFQMPPKQFWAAFDVSPDGQFLAIVPQTRAAEQPVAVVTNWKADVDRRAR